MQESYAPDRVTLTIEVEFDDTSLESKNTSLESKNTSIENENTSLESEGTTQEKIIQIMQNNPQITRQELANMLHLTLYGVKYHLKRLTGNGTIKHIGSTKAGEWIIL